MNSLRDRAEALAAKLNKIGAFQVTPFVVYHHEYQSSLVCEIEKVEVDLYEDDTCEIRHCESLIFRNIPTDELLGLFDKHYSNQ